jgi:hypothetical protein
MPTASRYRAPLQMHTVVEQPLTQLSGGRIVCRPMGLPPVDLVWHGPNGRMVQTDQTGTEAVHVVPGKYRVTATDAEGQRADVTVEIEPLLPHAVVVTEYRVTPASTSVSRDGSVEAIGSGLDNTRLLWTNGVETRSALLRDVPPGMYAATLVEDGMFVHCCPPAHVAVAGLSRG